MKLHMVQSNYLRGRLMGNSKNSLVRKNFSSFTFYKITIIRSFCTTINPLKYGLTVKWHYCKKNSRYKFPEIGVLPLRSLHSDRQNDKVHSKQNRKKYYEVLWSKITSSSGKVCL